MPRGSSGHGADGAAHDRAHRSAERAAHGRAGRGAPRAADGRADGVRSGLESELRLLARQRQQCFHIGFHIVEIDGFGGNDRPIATARPLMVTGTVNAFQQDATQRAQEFAVTLFFAANILRERPPAHEQLHRVQRRLGNGQVPT